MTIKDFENLGRAADDPSLETIALEISGFEDGAESYGKDREDADKAAEAGGPSKEASTPPAG